MKVFVECEADRYEEAKREVRRVGKRLGQKAMYFEIQYFDGVRILRVE